MNLTLAQLYLNHKLCLASAYKFLRKDSKTFREEIVSFTNQDIFLNQITLRLYLKYFLVVKGFYFIT